MPWQFLLVDLGLGFLKRRTFAQSPWSRLVDALFCGTL